MSTNPSQRERFGLISAGGSSVFASNATRDRLAVGTTDGVWLLRRDAEGYWSLSEKALAGTFISSLTWTEDGAIVAGTHHFGIARSDDGGRTWKWINKGITQFDVWVVKAERLNGREVILAGTMPSALFISDNGGESWRELGGINKVATAKGWFFPPPPHLGHVKDIVVQNGRDLLVGIEVGAFLLSSDGGESFKELPVASEFTDIDIHRIIVHPDRPEEITVATGWGVKKSVDGGSTWSAITVGEINYPDAMVVHPADPNVLFVAGAKGYPPNWYKINRARPQIARSSDGGQTWSRLLGGFPNGGRAAIGAMTFVVAPDGEALFVGDTDGQIFESRDGGETWEMIFETGAVSKGEHYRGLAKGRPPMTDLDNLTFAAAGQRRVDTAKA
jgi:photosystem II stability/assembly factor-like uncharacterized protein